MLWVSAIVLFLLQAEAQHDLACQGEADDSCFIQRPPQQRKQHGKENALVQQAEVASGNPTMNSVMSAFDGLDVHGIPLDVMKGSSFPAAGYNDFVPPYSTHFQGIARLRPGPPGSNSSFLALTGNSDTAGHLFIVEVSTPAHPGPVVGDQGPPEASVVSVEVVSSELTHAGGPAVWGDVLAVGTESHCSPFDLFFRGCEHRSKVWFYDVSNPKEPNRLAYSVDRQEGTAGAVGLTQLQNGTFLLVVGRTDSAILDFYTSDATSLLQPDVSWRLVSTWYKEALLVGAGLYPNFGSYQNLNLVTQEDGTVFLVGSTRTPILVGQDWFDLFTVNLGEGEGTTVTKVASRAMATDWCDFYAGAAVYVDTSTRMLAYCTWWNPFQSNGKIRINEFA